MTPSTNMYANRAYMETLLSYGTEANERQLSSQLWYEDTSVRVDAVEIIDGDTAYNLI